MLVRQILSSKPSHSILSIPPQGTVSEAVGLLSTHRIGALMVFSGGNTLEGVLSERDIVREIGDVVKARIDEVEHENSALTEMIAGHA